MTLILLCFFVGAFLLGIEVFVPGGILGTIGGLLMAVGCGLAFLDFGASGGWIAVAVAVGLIGAILWFDFVIFPKTSLGRRMFLNNATDGRSQPPIAVETDVVGREAEALTALAPTGYVSVDGRRYEAFCRAGFVDQGTRLTVISIDTFRLIVQPSESSITSK